MFNNTDDRMVPLTLRGLRFLMIISALFTLIITYYFTLFVKHSFLIIFLLCECLCLDYWFFMMYGINLLIWIIKVNMYLFTWYFFVLYFFHKVLTNQCMTPEASQKFMKCYKNKLVGINDLTSLNSAKAFDQVYCQ